MEASTPTTTAIAVRPLFSSEEQQALLGFLAGYSGLTRVDHGHPELIQTLLTPAACAAKTIASICSLVVWPVGIMSRSGSPSKAETVIVSW
jgi:hypothetical protein